MFRRIINNNIKTIGIRKFSNDNNNHRIVEELVKIRNALQGIRNALQGITICICGLNIMLSLKR
jgi:hypothetical protein